VEDPLGWVAPSLPSGASVVSDGVMTALDEKHPVYIFAMDQRASLLEHKFGQRSGEPSDDEIAKRVREGKRLIFEGLLAALHEGAPRERAAVLVDELYGADIARQAKELGIRLAMPIERSGRDWFELEYGEAWMAHVDEFDPDWVKVLVRDNPDLDPTRRRQQAERLAEVAEELHEAGRPYLVELLVPPTDAQRAAGDAYDSDIRPGLVVDVIRYLQDHGVEADLWKLEGLDRRADAERVVEAARRGGRDHVQCILLGRDAPQRQLDHWLEVAAPVEGFVGFAIGRSNWEAALDGVVTSDADPGMARERIAANYRHYVDTWTAACGDLSVEATATASNGADPVQPS
jgi:myo-inositol catabolism protein IolC